jgi:uncharacterized protein YjlB
MKSDIAVMYALQTIKSGLEHLTGIAQPTARELSNRIKKRKPRATLFKDNNCIPNNPTLPFIHYSNVLSLTGALDPAAVFERVFKANNWVGAWRNGIYDYVHYHPRTHEVLGIARGRARVRFGGKQGKLFHLKAGDVVILPAGTGHEAIRATKDLLVVGAYPVSGKYDEYTGRRDEHTKAVRMIPKVRLPSKDPVFGKKGPLKQLWKSGRR